MKNEFLKSLLLQKKGEKKKERNLMKKDYNIFEKKEKKELHYKKIYYFLYM